MLSHVKSRAGFQLYAMMQLYMYAVELVSTQRSYTLCKKTASLLFFKGLVLNRSWWLNLMTKSEFKNFAQSVVYLLLSVMYF